MPLTAYRKHGLMDLSNLLTMLKARSERVQEAFSAYAKGPVTLGILESGPEGICQGFFISRHPSASNLPALDATT